MKHLVGLKTLTLTASFLAVVGTASAAGAGSIANVTIGADTFYLYSAPNATWAADEAAANTDGGYLAILPDAATITAVYNGLIGNGFFQPGIASQVGEAYIGAIPADGSKNVMNAVHVTPANDWSWVTSVPANLYSGNTVPSVVPWTVGGNFNTGEPNGDSEGLALNRYGTFSFNDEGGTTGGYIEEVGPVPTPDGGLTIALLGMGISGMAFIRRKL